MPSQIPSVTTAPAASTQVAANPGSQLGKDDFLKIFVAQMSHQDPSKPMDDTAFMSQMASFSTLEQISNMASSSALVAANLAQGNAVALIGRTVTYADTAGGVHTGVVEKVSTIDGQGLLSVGGIDGIDPATVTQVS
jgi:flagellar basal-body rod modification protein FlgD